MRSIKASGHGSNSGALRSETHARVSSCKSRVSRGIAWLSTSAKMSSISIESVFLPSLTELLNQQLHKHTLASMLRNWCRAKNGDSLTDLPRPSALTVLRIDATETPKVFLLYQSTVKRLYKAKFLIYSRVSYQRLPKIMICLFFIGGGRYLDKVE